MVATKERKKREHVIGFKNNKDILKFAMVYGANGAGKTNLIDAMMLAKQISTVGIMSDLSRMYCRFKSGNVAKNTIFAFGLDIDGEKYEYSIELLLATNQIVLEKLTNASNGQLVFLRDYHKTILNLGEKYFKDKEAKIRIRMYDEDSITNKQISFLSVMNQNKDSLYEKYSDKGIVLLRKVFVALRDMLVIAKPGMAIENAMHYMYDESLDKISELLADFGTGITSLEKETIEKNELALVINNPMVYSSIINSFMINSSSVLAKGEKKMVSGTIHINNDMYLMRRESLMKDMELYKVFAKHKNNPDEKYALSEESDGTRRLLELIEVLINEGEGMTFVVDEFDRCLHPILAKKFVKNFLLNETKSQLIVTTHQDNLLDQELVRRDEVWFAGRKNDESTELYSLGKYEGRFDKALRKAYLDGEYGGIPEGIKM